MHHHLQKAKIARFPQNGIGLAGKRLIKNQTNHYLCENIQKMSRIKDFYVKYLSWINIYWLVTIAFLIVTFTLGDSSLYKRYTYDEKIRSLEREIKHYEEEIEANTKKLDDLHTDKEGLERFAREEYFMKRANEDIFIIKGNE